MTEQFETTQPTFSRIELSKVGQLEDLKSPAKTFRQRLNETIIKIHEETLTDKGTIESEALKIVIEETRVRFNLSNQGREFWETNGKKELILDNWQKPLAGIFLAILGTAQELAPEEIERIGKGHPLNTSCAKEFMFLARLYDDIVERSSRPGCLGRLFGQKDKPRDQIYQTEGKVREAFKKR